jgi:hypothetical protein
MGKKTFDLEPLFLIGQKRRHDVQQNGSKQNDTQCFSNMFCYYSSCIVLVYVIYNVILFLVETFWVNVIKLFYGRNLQSFV